MATKARRLPVRVPHSWSRRARRMLYAGLAALVPVATTGAAAEDGIVSARYIEPTTRYAHGVLGDKIEHGALELHLEGSRAHTIIRLPEERVFEDTEPRVVDVDGDGRAEVVVVEAHRDQGARLAIYNTRGLVAATPYIGQRNRWLAPVAIADLDGDGAIELAYIDRPHLAKILKVWRYGADRLTQVASLDGLTNHRIGERDIAGGLRDCGAGLEMVVASADWQRLIGVRFTGMSVVTRDIGPHRDRSSFSAALACE